MVHLVFLWDLVEVFPGPVLPVTFLLLAFWGLDPLTGGILLRPGVCAAEATALVSGILFLHPVLGGPLV